jgi:hypothetical protein
MITDLFSNLALLNPTAHSSLGRICSLRENCGVATHKKTVGQARQPTSNNVCPAASGFKRLKSHFDLTISYAKNGSEVIAAQGLISWISADKAGKNTRTLGVQDTQKVISKSMSTALPGQVKKKGCTSVQPFR